MKIEIQKDLENYSYWIKVNNFLMGPSLVLSLFIIISFIAATIIALFKPEIIAPYLAYYYFSFPIFIIAVWLVFTGFLLREI